MNEKLKAFVDLLGDFDTTMLVTELPGGGLISRPMSIQEPRPDRALWFVTSSDTVTAQNVAANGKVNLSFHRRSDHAWVSVSGKAVINGDSNLVSSLWKSDWNIWFPQGKATPNIVLLEVLPDQIDFWETAHGKIGTLFQMAKAAVTDSAPNLPPTHTLRVSDIELAGAMCEQ
jgi:general stress protein 26